MNPIDIIIKKKNKQNLTYEEIEYMINGYISGEVKDYQMSALLMAICLNSMTFDETYYLTDIMLKSGDKFDYGDLKGIKVDKHSTGGVGDKVTIALAPIVASCGIIFPKMSGRGLGHTGGTIDKLESIEGFNTQLSEEKFIDNLKKIGVAISGQTKKLVPADKKLYALRDVTGTVDSIPLIASSIMSKKLAVDADIISLDVKVGSGAFMKNIDDARCLAKTMVEIGKRFNKKVVVSLTDMSTPLGYTIGNSLEVLEAIKMVRGELDNDFSKLVIYFASHIVSLALNKTIEEAESIVLDVIKSSKAYNKLIELVVYQNGNVDYIKNLDNLRSAKYKIEIKSERSGYVSSLDAFKLGDIASKLGAGRVSLDDEVDHSVGIELLKKRGDYVSKGDIIAIIHSNYDNNDIYINELKNAYKYSDKEVVNQLVLDTIM